MSGEKVETLDSVGDLARGTRDRAWSLAERGREARGHSSHHRARTPSLVRDLLFFPPPYAPTEL